MSCVSVMQCYGMAIQLRSLNLQEASSMDYRLMHGMERENYLIVEDEVKARR